MSSEEIGSAKGRYTITGPTNSCHAGSNKQSLFYMVSVLGSGEELARLAAWPLGWHGLGTASSGVEGPRCAHGVAGVAQGSSGGQSSIGV